MSGWLITGATGLLGPYLVDACSGYEVYTLASKDADINCNLTADNYEFPLPFEPHVVLHAAAATNVDWCSANVYQASLLNEVATERLVKIFYRASKFVYISTDMVYPDKEGPHKENAADPINHYGMGKWNGENEVLDHRFPLILRTNFFGPSLTPGRESLSDWVLRERPTEAYSDKFSPLHMQTLAELIVELVERGLTGTFNAGCRNGVSKATFARRVLSKQTWTGDGYAYYDGPDIKEIDRPPGGAPRPKDMRMDVSRLESRIGRRMPTIDEEIAKL